MKKYLILILIIVDAILVSLLYFGYKIDILPLNIFGTLVVLIFVVSSFIIAWLLDYLKPILESLGNLFGGTGGLLGR
jgi:undecaprenyl pyrophosphate phosphatase UppP